MEHSKTKRLLRYKLVIISVRGGLEILNIDKGKNDMIITIENITKKEEKLLKLIRETEFGELKLSVRNRQPAVIEEIRKSIKL